MLTVVLCAFSSIVNAWSCGQYKVHIKNIGSADCVLKNKYILYGKLTEQSQIPEVIFRGEQVRFEMTNNKSSTMFLETGTLLSYNCGDDKEVTFFTTTNMQKPSFIKTDKSLSAIIEAKNMDVSFNESRCNNIYGTSNEITWVLNP